MGNSSNLSSDSSVTSSMASVLPSACSTLCNEVEWKKYELPSSDVSESIVLLTLTTVPSGKTFSV